jgi:nucleotide-binding universal stress UspA family protein
VQASIKKIILATDFSDISKDASYYALQLAHAFKAELIALYAFDIGVWKIPSKHLTIGGLDKISGSQAQARQQGKDNLKRLADSIDLEVETIFAEGDPGHEIVRVAEERKADLIVLGTHGHTGWKHFSLGSVAELVVRHAPCAVLTIKPKGK